MGPSVVEGNETQQEEKEGWIFQHAKMGVCKTMKYIRGGQGEMKHFFLPFIYLLHSFIHCFIYLFIVNQMWDVSGVHQVTKVNVTGKNGQ